MTDWMAYAEIQEYKRKGLKISQVSRQLNIDRKTVAKYWDMSLDEYSNLVTTAKTRYKKVEKFENRLLEWLKSYPDISSAQLYDWLLERNGRLDFKERTLRLFVADLRKKHKIPKCTYLRQYEAVEDPPFGYQAQVDMGEIWLATPNGAKVKLYCFVMVLTNSRYKFVYWLDKPFNALSFIEAHNKAFEYFNGRPQEIVYDHDKVLTVSENHGDIVYTGAFQKYIDFMKFKIYLCRGNDPESKGRIEAAVKYVKYNFAKHRTYTDLVDFNELCLKWLERTGNGKMHEITKKVPAEVFEFEKQHLEPAPKYEINLTENILTYSLRKDNTIMYKQNRYRVPKGTYSPNKRVNVKIESNKMTIMDIETGEIYAIHKISSGKGELISLNHEDRDTSASLNTLYIKTFDALNNSNNVRMFLDNIKKCKPRYFRDQLGLILKTLIGIQDTEIVRLAVDYCVTNTLWSASEFVTAIKYYQEVKKCTQTQSSEVINIPDKYKGLKPSVRDIEEYAKLLVERR